MLLVLMFLLYLLFFSGRDQESVINYKGLNYETKVREFVKANYYLGRWHRTNGESNEYLAEYEGKVRFALSNGLPAKHTVSLDDEADRRLEEGKARPRRNDWELYIYLFDSTYIDRHLHRIIMRGGAVDEDQKNNT